MKRHVLIPIILISCLFLISCGESADSKDMDFSKPKIELLSKIKPLAELITSEKPSLKEAVRLIGGTVKEQVKEKYVFVESNGYRTTLVTTNKDILVTDVEIHTELDMGIEFHKDMVPLLGEWTEIAKHSKYPGARFIYKNRRTGKKAFVFVDLYYPPQNPLSPVQGIVIRIERPPKTGQK